MEILPRKLDTDLGVPCIPDATSEKTGIQTEAETHVYAWGKALELCWSVRKHVRIQCVVR